MSKLIIIDWGTSNFRAKILNENFKEIDSISSNDGILHLERNEFHAYLINILKTWLEKESIILMSGMIGSMNGWVETSYIECDASINGLSKKIVKIPNIKENIYIVPGVKSLKNGLIDLMRGEEVQVFGALALLKQSQGIFILPGTHSKWVKVINKHIIDFKTNMTGEVFDLLSTKSILAKSISSKTMNEEAFLKGLNISFKESGFLNHIFQSRAQVKIIDKKNIYSFLSGIVIGNEIKEMKKLFSCTQVIIVGSHTLNTLYEIALNFYSIKTKKVNASMAINASMKYLYQKLKDN